MRTQHLLKLLLIKYYIIEFIEKLNYNNIVTFMPKSMMNNILYFIL